MKAAIVIDNWKLPIFEKHLVGAGYSFKETIGFTNKGKPDGTMIIKISYEDLKALQAVVTAANTECEEVKAAKKSSTVQ